MKILKKTLIAIAIIIVALLLLVMALSPVAKRVVNNHGQQLIGRDLQVDKVFINPFFGPLMGVKDNRNLISEDEMSEMMELLGDDTLSLAPAVAPLSDTAIAN